MAIDEIIKHKVADTNPNARAIARRFNVPASQFSNLYAAVRKKMESPDYMAAHKAATATAKAAACGGG